MATLRVERRNVHWYLVAILILAALTVALSRMSGHKPPPRFGHSVTNVPSATA